MKWEPVAAMLALLVLGLWVVWGPAAGSRLVDVPTDATTAQVLLGNQRGVAAMIPGAADEKPTFRIFLRGQEHFQSAPMNEPEFRAFFDGWPA